MRIEGVTRSLLWIALLLVGLWLVARVVLALTSVALHLLWIGALLFAILWLVRRFSRG